MNLPSFEIGWIVTRSEAYDDYYADGRLFKKILEDQPEADEIGYVVPDTLDHPEGADPVSLTLETHPHFLFRVFVSWCPPGHGWSDLTEPKALSQIVRQFIAKYDPNAHVTWGIIETER